MIRPFQIIWILFTLLCPISLQAFDQNHALWTQVLKDYVRSDGMVYYQRLKTDLTKKEDHPFRRYQKQIQDLRLQEFESWSAADQKAFLINAYNALTVQLILDHYPVKSIKDIGSIFRRPWKIAFFRLLGGTLETLDQLEHEVLRKRYRDFRIHAAVNCASFSCPVLRQEAFVGARLEEQLDDQMRLWLKDSTRNRLRSELESLEISRIFDWYQDDFEIWGGGVRKVLETYAPQELKGQQIFQRKIQYLEYNWNLNQAL